VSRCSRVIRREGRRRWVVTLERKKERNQRTQVDLAMVQLSLKHRKTAEFGLTVIHFVELTLFGPRDPLQGQKPLPSGHSFADRNTTGQKDISKPGTNPWLASTPPRRLPVQLSRLAPNHPLDSSTPTGVSGIA